MILAQILTERIFEMLAFPLRTSISRFNISFHRESSISSCNICPTYIQNKCQKGYLKLIILLEVLPNNILVVPGASLYLGKVWLDASMPLKLLYFYHLSHQCPAFPYIRLYQENAPVKWTTYD